METMSIAIVLVGLGALEAGVVGALLPPEHRLGAALALVAGAGVGVIVLAVGASDGSGPAEEVFLIGSIAGLLTVSAVLGLVWRRSRPVRGADQPGPDDLRSSARHSVR
jgi:hypothetical protein